VTLVPGRDLIERARAAGRSALDEAEAKQLFASYGIPTPAGRMVASGGDAVAAARDVGFPVVMKGGGERVQHKTDAGLVVLNVRDEHGVRETFELLGQRVKAVAGENAERTVLVEHMVKSEREFVVGMVSDHLFGPVVMFGLGGIFTEAFKDVAFGIAPLDEADALEMLDCIRGKALLGPVRAFPAVDRGLLAAIIQAVGRMAEDHPEIREIDVNPVLVDGSDPIAVDALVTLGDPVAPARRMPASEEHMRSLVAPKSVVVVGASSDKAKWGGMIICNLLGGGFEGAIYPVNPKGGTIMGLQVYPSVAEIPDSAELALIAVPAPLVDGALDECGKKGVKAAVVVSAGFSETGPEGRQMEDKIIATAERYEMALVGPNCMGVISSHHDLYATGFMVLRPKPGGASFISQSGNLGIQLLAAAERRGGGVGKFVGVGNEAMIDAVDLIHYLCGDSETTTIIAYLEGFDDGRRLLQVVRETSLQKPVLVLRGGVTDYGKRAAASHTGAMASSSEIFNAAARQSGMIVTSDPDEFMDLTFALSYLPLPRGKRVAVITMGGGWGVLTADEVGRSGLQLAELPAPLIDDLDALLPTFWSRSNPIDLVSSIAPGVPEGVVERIVRSDAVDALVVLGVVGSLGERSPGDAAACRAGGAAVSEGSGADGGGEECSPELSAREVAFLRHSAELMAAHCKPIINISIKPLEKAVFPDSGRYSALLLPSPLRAVRILAHMARYSAYLTAKGREVPC
jgi:acyl-CoA synthetase (NDP forming)